MAPKKAKLAVAEEKLEAAKKKLAEKQADLAAMEAKVQKLQRSYDESVQKGKNLEAEMKITQVRSGPSPAPQGCAVGEDKSCSVASYLTADHGSIPPPGRPGSVPAPAEASHAIPMT